MLEESLKKIEEKDLEELISKINILTDIANELKLVIDAVGEQMILNSAEIAEKLGSVASEIAVDKTVELVRELNKSGDKLIALLKAVKDLDERAVYSLIDLANFSKLMQDVLTENMLTRNAEMLERLGRLLSEIDNEKIIAKLDRLLKVLEKVEEEKLEKIVLTVSMLDERAIDIIAKLDDKAIDVLEKSIGMLKTKEMKRIIDSLSDKKVLRVLDAMLYSVKETDFRKPEVKVGLFGAVNLLRDPDIQKLLGAMVTLAKNFQRNL